MFYSHFFKVGSFFCKNQTPNGWLSLLQNPHRMRHFLAQLLTQQKSRNYSGDNYLFDHFVQVGSGFTQHSQSFVKAYFLGEVSLNAVCHDLIRFCISQGVSLDREATLLSFADHDAITNKKVQQSLLTLSPRRQLTMLGYGLGDAMFEKNIAKWIIEQNIAEEVTLFGFDPYANPIADVHMLDKSTLHSDLAPVFDIITARWVLHHVKREDRWQPFIDCVNRCSQGGQVLVVEHGFFTQQEMNKIPEEHRRFYLLLMGMFDTLANFSIRPQLFLSTNPAGKNFTIDYLSPADLQEITSHAQINCIEHIGPEFPNQTLYSMTPI